jgi:hypothetical protein
MMKGLAAAETMREDKSDKPRKKEGYWSQAIPTAASASTQSDC